MDRSKYFFKVRYDEESGQWIRIPVSLEQIASREVISQLEELRWEFIESALELSELREANDLLSYIMEK
jgi:hypothetical protein